MNENDIITQIAGMADEDGVTVEDLINSIKTDRGAKKRSDAVTKDVEEFRKVFPDVTPEEIPDGVWQSVADGVPLAAAYALHIYVSGSRKTAADRVNADNARRSAPAGKDADADESYTSEQVEDMSPEAVKKNFKGIIKSLRGWKI
ncbi:MAG: hypothetical protein ACI3W9_05770 [Eubacteriales bacterium]